MVKAIDIVTETAHLHLVGVLKKIKTGASIAKSDFPYSSDERIRHFLDTLGGSNSSLKCAAAGYIIEDYVSAHFKGKPGYETQVVHSNARPDFVVTDTAKDKEAVVDLTASGDVGHILDKNFNTGTYDLVMETLYPSINFNDIDATDMNISDSLMASMDLVRAARADAKLSWWLGQVRADLDLTINAGRTIYPESLPWAEEARKTLRTYFGGTQKGNLGPLLNTLDEQIRGYNKARREEKFGHTTHSILGILNELRNKYGVTGMPSWASS